MRVRNHFVTLLLFRSTWRQSLPTWPPCILLHSQQKHLHRQERALICEKRSAVEGCCSFR